VDSPKRFKIFERDVVFELRRNHVCIKVFWSATIALFLVSAGLSNTLAMDSNGRYFALGAGSRFCEDYIKFREKRLENLTLEQYEMARVIVEHWMAGYFTAHNFYVTDTYDVVGTVTMEQLKDRIEKFCRSNPSNRIAEGVAAIAQELHTNRIKLDTGTKASEKPPAK
jgi:hypothetical protein